MKLIIEIKDAGGESGNHNVLYALTGDGVFRPRWETGADIAPFPPKYASMLSAATDRLMRLVPCIQKAIDDFYSENSATTSSGESDVE